jgi:hypothetical protein
VDRWSDSIAVKRLHQFLLLGSIIPLSWLGMMIVHEGGHVIAAWATGAGVSKVVLHPLAFSRTDLSHNPRPLLVAWAGAILGAFLPLAALGLAILAHAPGRYLLRFFAGFCLVANGAYIGVGWAIRAGDAGDLLRYGAARWQLVAFGALALPLGLVLWNGIGEHFGLGTARGRVSRSAAYVTIAVFVAVILLELAIGGE